MQSIYLGCLSLGIFFAVITILFGDLLDSAFDGFFQIFSLDGFDFLHPSVIVAGITVFGGTGLLLNEYSPGQTVFSFLLTIIISLLFSAVFYFIYVRPMKNCENSIGFSRQNFIGKIGEVSIPISPKGFGEIILQMGASLTNQIAASSDGMEYAAGTKVIVTQIKDDTLYVCRYNENSSPPEQTATSNTQSP